MHRAKFLILGLILLLSPVVLVVFQSSNCSSEKTLCFAENVNKYVDTFFPYLMLSGGLFIAFGMRKIADSLLVETEDEPETKE